MSLLRQLPPRPGPGEADENGWMDVSELVRILMVSSTYMTA